MDNSTMKVIDTRKIAKQIFEILEKEKMPISIAREILKEVDVKLDNYTMRPHQSNIPQELNIGETVENINVNIDMDTDNFVEKLYNKIKAANQL